MINIAIADANPLMRHGIKDTISSVEGFEVTIDVSNGMELLDSLKKMEDLPDICILDTDMPVMNGYETLKELKKNWSSIRVLIFSMFYTEFSVYQSLTNGANGCLEKNCNQRRLLHALSSIYYSEYYYSETIAKKVFELQHSRSKLLPHITTREMEFLHHVCSDLSYKEIGDQMNVSVRTVETYRDALFTKFNIKTRTGLAMFALQNGIVPIHKAKD